MRRVDLDAYPGTAEWIASAGAVRGAAGPEWKKHWTARTEEEVVADFQAHGMEAVLVAFDIESVTGAPPVSSAYVAAMRDRHPETFIGAWGTVDPLRGEEAIADAERAVDEHRVLGFDFHPIMGRYSVDDPALRPLFETITGLRVPVMGAGLGEALLGVHGPGDAEVGDLDPAIGHDQHVARLHVAVDEP